MGNVAGFNVYSPWEKAPQPTFVEQYPEVERKALDLIAEIFQKNTRAGKADIFRVCAIHRAKGIHRWFNVAMNIPNRSVRCEREYGGALAHAEALIDGPWRIGTDEEEKACEAKDEQDRQNAMKSNRENLTAGMREIGKELVSAMASAASTGKKG